MKKIIFAFALMCAMTACSGTTVSTSEDTVVIDSTINDTDICEIDTVL